MEFFTSINNNYLPKARVLAKSLKKFNPEARFSVVISEKNSAIKLAIQDNEPFDEVIGIEELDIPFINKDPWIFKHNVVELCTAVKPFAFKEITKRRGDQKIVYLDPDIAVFASLSVIEQLLEQYSYLLTPHLTHPEVTKYGIRDNEQSVLKHGIFNLGFLAINNDDNSKQLIDWWSMRLLYQCYDDISQGLFTDQKWFDLAVIFFPNFKIIKDKVFNVAPWNIATRNITYDSQDNPCIENERLLFYHFTGFDSGAHQQQLNIYDSKSQILKLINWYKSELAQQYSGDHKWSYGYFTNGQKITNNQRIHYRHDEQNFQNHLSPFDIESMNDQLTEQELTFLYKQYLHIKESITWKVLKFIFIKLNLFKILNSLKK